ncbi:MAG TPA: WhiB family transcriptional regulator [Acidimicrobiales bacterium]|nr:WhiB family transcriptional regulator [Acidimicrobiales bacterium]
MNDELYLNDEGSLITRDSASNTSWMSRGSCVDKPPSLFFPSDGVGVEVARKICESCQVREKCLDYALANRIDHGVWGGTSERQRRRILRSRRSRSAISSGDQKT